MMAMSLGEWKRGCTHLSIPHICLYPVAQKSCHLQFEIHVDEFVALLVLDMPDNQQYRS